MPIQTIDSWMFDNRRISQEQKRSLLPRHCYLSKKSIWFKKCDVITCLVTGLGDPVWETFWCDPKEFLLHELKR